MKQTGNTILITGGGSGIGAALAQRWHDAGNTVIIAGRRQEALDEVANGRDNIHTMTIDVDSAEGVTDFAKRVIEAHPDLNVLINNAGIMRFETLETQRDLSDAEETVTTNLLGPIRLTNALIDHLKGKDDAVIVTVTSGLAFVPLVDAPTYCATKAAIHSYTLSLRNALDGKVEVIELAPPGVQTTLTPGQEKRSMYQPLDDFADEVMRLFGEQPTPKEILVERVRGFRNAERDGNFDATMKQLNDFARKAREEGNASA